MSDRLGTAWHEGEITEHLDQLAAVVDPADPAAVRLEAVLQIYAQIQHRSPGHHGSELATLLHCGEQVDRAQQRLRDFIQDLLAEAAQAGDLRGDVRPPRGPATACTPSQQPVPSPARKRSTAWSPSPWPNYVQHGRHHLLITRGDKLDPTSRPL